MAVELDLEPGQEAFGVERRHAARARRGDGLTISVVHHVPAGEDAGDFGARLARLNDHIATIVER